MGTLRVVMTVSAENDFFENWPGKAYSELIENVSWF